MNKNALTLALAKHKELEQLLSDRSELERRHAEALKKNQSDINQCSAKLAAALSMIES